MVDLKKAMKLSLIYGLAGAVLVSLLYETYANISRTIGLFLAAVWVIFVGIKFSALSFREAFVGVTCCLAYTGILGVICYVLVHPRIVAVLAERSVYFQLSLKEQAYFALYLALIFLCMYIIWAVRFGLTKALERFRSNREKTGEYIDNAFDDSHGEDL